MISPSPSRSLAAGLAPCALVLTCVACSGGGAPRSPGEIGRAEAVRPPLVASPSVAATPAPQPARAKPLFDRIGGRERLSRAVEFFLTVVVQDARVKKLFEPIARDRERRRHVRDAMIDQICAVAGGGCAYAGDAREVHKGMKITQVQWDAFVEDLAASLRHEEVGDAEQHELIEALGGLQKDIVEK